MLSNTCSILTIAPYRILPVSSGGHAAIVHLHHYIGKICPDHVVGTKDNGENNNAFDLHPVFSSGTERYIPFNNRLSLLSIAKKYDVNHIICEHPYMAFSAMQLSKKLKIPWFLRSHNIESERFRALGKKWWRGLQLYEQYAMQHADGIFFITPEDAAWAQTNFQLPGRKCHFIPFGTILEAPPGGHVEAKNILAEQLQISSAVPWLYFLGALDYYPNQQAITFILDEVIPRLDQKNKHYQFLITGKGLPEQLVNRVLQTPSVKYTGFISNLDTLLKACDIMINPVLLGGGIKTKVVEALGYNKIVISTQSGAAGLLPEVCGDNLKISADKDWEAFAHNIVQSFIQKPGIPLEFYNTYYWGNIARKAVKILNETS